jgi:predicted HicB family RNase H-like nuclease
MKRVINGVTYNTNTSTRIARAERTDEASHGRPAQRREWVLYQTLGGAFFLVCTTETGWETSDGEWKNVVNQEVQPISRERAQAWIFESQVELLTDVFANTPEAAAEDAPGATLYIRVLASLKNQADRLARDEGVSLNAWVMRCVERGIALTREARGC